MTSERAVEPRTKHVWFIASTATGLAVSLALGQDQAFGVFFGMLLGYWARGWFR